MMASRPRLKAAAKVLAAGWTFIILHDIGGEGGGDRGEILPLDRLQIAPDDGGVCVFHHALIEQAGRHPDREFQELLGHAFGSVINAR